MQPVAFSCTQFIPHSSAILCAEIANTARWNQFGGYGPLPGIAGAEYERRTPDMVGSRIRVRNRDGSQHVEEILRWEPEHAVELRLQEFTPPLSRIAAQFVEEWRFLPQGSGTLVTRTIRMVPTRPAARPALWLISLLMRRAIAHHLRQMAA